MGAFKVNQLHKEGAIMPQSEQEKYIYQVDKITFVVTPVYNESGETMQDILLKLMRADLERA